MTEDVITGLTIHKKGWKSTFPMPNPPAFLGCAPSGGPAAMTQQKRWATGLLEILVSDKSPIFATLTDRLQFRMFLAYFWILSWGLGSIPELCYAALPAYCIIANSHFLPKVRRIYMQYNIQLTGRSMPRLCPLKFLLYRSKKLIKLNQIFGSLCVISLSPTSETRTLPAEIVRLITTICS